MRGITNTFAIAGIAGALMMGALAPAAAQTAAWSNNGGYYGQTYGGYGYGGYANRGPLVEAPVAGRADVPYTASRAPYAPNWAWGQCVTDEGYGRTLPCDNNGGGR